MKVLPVPVSASPSASTRPTSAQPTTCSSSDKKPVGVIEAKPEDWGQKITTVEDQSAGYAAAKFKWLNNKEPLPFIYESTGLDNTRAPGEHRS